MTDRSDPFEGTGRGSGEVSGGGSEGLSAGSGASDVSAGPSDDSSVEPAGDSDGRSAEWAGRAGGDVEAARDIGSADLSGSPGEPAGLGSADAAAASPADRTVTEPEQQGPDKEKREHEGGAPADHADIEESGSHAATRLENDAAVRQEAAEALETQQPERSGFWDRTKSVAGKAVDVVQTGIVAGATAVSETATTPGVRMLSGAVADFTEAAGKEKDHRLIAGTRRAIAGLPVSGAGVSAADGLSAEAKDTLEQGLELRGPLRRRPDEEAPPDNDRA